MGVKHYPCASSLKVLSGVLRNSNFRNKEELLLAIDQYIRGRINKKMKGVSRGPDPLENVIALASTTLHFFLQEPAAIEVLKEVRYKQEETPSPREDKAQQLFRDAVSDLQCPALIQPAAFEEALEAIRVMLVGAGECIRITKPQKREVVLTATLNGLRSLIKGWGYHPH